MGSQWLLVPFQWLTPSHKDLKVKWVTTTFLTWSVWRMQRPVAKENTQIHIYFIYASIYLYTVVRYSKSKSKLNTQDCRQRQSHFSGRFVLPWLTFFAEKLPWSLQWLTSALEQPCFENILRPWHPCSQKGVKMPPQGQLDEAWFPDAPQWLTRKFLY